MTDIEEDELGSVLREICDAMKARGAALTLHPDGEYKSRVIYVDQAAAISRTAVEELLAAGAILPESTPGEQSSWLACAIDDHCRDALSITVSAVSDHSRLVLTVFFDDLTDELRAHAEAVYSTRRPAAVGYFRLWQTQRATMRQVQASEAALNLMHLGVIILTASSKIAYANLTARSLLRRGTSLRQRDQRLHACNAQEDARLQTLLSHIAIDQGEVRSRETLPMLALKRENKAALILSILASDQIAREPNDVTAIVFVVDPTEKVDVLIKPVCMLFKLSNVECRLVAQMVAGLSLKDAAVSMQIKEEPHGATSRLF